MMQQVFERKESLSKLSAFLKDRQVKSVMLITGKSSYTKSSAISIIEPQLLGLKTVRFYEFQENPKVKDLKTGIEIFNNNACEAIVAIGGGSVMDMAKLIKAYHDSSEDIAVQIASNKTGALKTELIAIPTTAGSGSEATHFAVVYNEGVKYSVADEKLLPNQVYLIPELTYTVSPYLTAVTGLDAFSQAIESWWSIYSTEETINYSNEATVLIWNNLKEAIKGNKEAKTLIQRAAHLAGKAINITKTTAPHALSYGFTTYCNLPHGHAVSLFLPSFMKLHSQATELNCIDSRGYQWLVNVMEDIARNLKLNVSDLERGVTEFINSCGIRINVNDLKISEDMIEQAMTGINMERLKNNPVKFNIDFVKAILVWKTD